MLERDAAAADRHVAVRRRRLAGGRSDVRTASSPAPDREPTCRSRLDDLEDRAPPACRPTTSRRTPRCSSPTRACWPPSSTRCPTCRRAPKARSASAGWSAARDGWGATGSQRPDGSYAVCRWDADRLELVSDNLASRAIWYVLDGDTLPRLDVPAGAGLPARRPAPQPRRRRVAGLQRHPGPRPAPGTRGCSACRRQPCSLSTAAPGRPGLCAKNRSTSTSEAAPGRGPSRALARRHPRDTAPSSTSPSTPGCCRSPAASTAARFSRP